MNFIKKQAEINLVENLAITFSDKLHRWIDKVKA